MKQIGNLGLELQGDIKLRLKFLYLNGNQHRFCHQGDITCSTLHTAETAGIAAALLNGWQSWGEDIPHAKNPASVSKSAPTTG